MSFPFNFPKALAACAAAGVLGLQLYMILPGTPEGISYWPFGSYPMYSRAAHRGDLVEMLELRLEPCDRSPEPETFDARRLGVKYLFLYDLLAAAHGRTEPWDPPASVARAQLGRIVEDAFPGAYCEAQLWTRRYVVGVDDPLHTDHSSQLADRFAVSGGAAPAVGS